MKSRINCKDKSYYLSISLRTWVYIMSLIRLDLEKGHTSFFKDIFSFEFSELEELKEFIPPFLLSGESSVFLKFK